MPSALIIYAIFAVTISNLLSNKLYLPLQRLEKEIELFKESESPINFPNTTKNELLEFKKLEDFLIKAFALARAKTSAERELAQVAGQAAHDICSPLMALQITYEQIPNLSPEQRSFLKRANASISEIAHSLLAKYSAYKDIVTDKSNNFMTISENCSALTKEPTNIATLINDFVELKKVQFSNVQNINFVEHINQNAKKLFSVINASQLTRILSNIVNNAVEAIAAAKRKNGIIEITIEKHNHFVAIIIADNGCGMSQELIDKIGAKEYSEGKKGGHGIGLFTAIKQIKAWHGNYKISSEINQGTKFCIYLPIV